MDACWAEKLDDAVACEDKTDHSRLLSSVVVCDVVGDVVKVVVWLVV